MKHLALAGRIVRVRDPLLTLFSLEAELGGQVYRVVRYVDAQTARQLERRAREVALELVFHELERLAYGETRALEPNPRTGVVDWSSWS